MFTQYSSSEILFLHIIIMLLLLSRVSRVRLCATPQKAAQQAPPSMGFSRQEYWTGVPLPSLNRCLGDADAAGLGRPTPTLRITGLGLLCDRQQLHINNLRQQRFTSHPHHISIMSQIF